MGLYPQTPEPLKGAMTSAEKLSRNSPTPTRACLWLFLKKFYVRIHMCTRASICVRELRAALKFDRHVRIWGDEMKMG